MTGTSGPTRWIARAACLWPLVLAGACQTQTVEIPVAPIRVVDVGRAADAFSEICLETAPGFGAARDRFARHGLTIDQDKGITYDETGTLSVRVDDLETSRGRKLRCSVVYEDPNRYIAEERISTLVQAAPGRARGPRRAQFPSADGGLRAGRAWSYSTNGSTGELLDVPHGGRGDLGVLILQFPAPR